MKATANTVFDMLSRLRIYFLRGHAIRNYTNDEPFRSELYNSDQMELHGKIVAGSHKLLKKHAADQLLKRLDDNEKTLLEVRNLLVESIRAGKTITPGGEWLLDNFYLIEEQVVIARKHLPKGYSEGLPCLANGISKGLPRVYDIVLEIISHSDGRVDVKSLNGFLTAYQSCEILTLGELWAIPIMLRLAVIENLRRVSGKIALDMIDHNLADYWADKMMTTLQDEPGDLILTIADMARSRPLLDSPFVAGFTRKLQGKGPALALPLSWMEQQLSGLGLSSNELVRQENQKQASDQVSVRNSIGTLRLLGATDWRDFVEALSSVEQVLKQDITGIYPLMDFATRDRYRHVVESISKASAFTETEVALHVLSLTEKNNTAHKVSDREQHVGYYLIDKGLKQTEQVTSRRFTIRHKLIRAASRIPVFLYLLAFTCCTLLVAGSMFWLAYTYGMHSVWTLIFVAVLSISGAAQLSVSLVNWWATLLVKPTFLPRLDFSKGIPIEYRTLIVIPTMLSSAAYIEELIESLEIRFLANREKQLHYGLLTDFSDASLEHMPEDQDLLKLVSLRIDALNEHYKQSSEDIFFLFHRSRTWNNAEEKWMGYERKRGKLAALNALLRGRSKGEFSTVIGNYDILTNIKYVITLDSDTQLPREAAWKFIATMAHPLNHPIYNEELKRVTDGYGILQPRVGSGISKSAASLYLKMQGNTSGIDPYTRLSSDVYQDLFKEGSFIGKGIYDVDVFEKSLNGVFQENRILSHDLLEGCYTRSGLLSDVMLYEDGPAQYTSDIKRYHRWIRGDWQIAAWMMPFITGANGHLVPNKLSALSRWKIFDNIRRSLLPVSLVLLLVMGWSVLPFPWFWTLTVTFIILLPVMAAAAWQLIHKPLDLTLKAHLSEVGTSVRDVLIRFIFGIAVLPYEAYRNTDAILRTNWRMIVSRKKLLQWTPSASPAFSDHGIWSAYYTMWMSPLLGVVFTVWLAYTHPLALGVASPMLVLWLLAPAIAWRISIPEAEEDLSLPEDQTVFLHKSARRTWSFFEQFVTAEENWLPPDNFQEQPVPVIAHRTSPTNMGLALLSNLTAYDFGYISGGELIVRCDHTLQTMMKLERYQGHFYNWYDTVSLLPLQPRYVSTVDSGNLVGHLLTLRQGLLTLSNQPVVTARIYEGLITTASIIWDLSKGQHIEQIESIQALLHVAANDSDRLLSNEKKYLEELYSLTKILVAHQTETSTPFYKWIVRLAVQVQQQYDEVIQFNSWLQLGIIPERFNELHILDGIPSLQSMEATTDLALRHIKQYEEQNLSIQEKEWLESLRYCLLKTNSIAAERLIVLNTLTQQCELLSDIEYEFLYVKSTGLLRIGFNVDEQRKDNSFYDLLASEARLGIFVAIAQGKLPQESWFALGRLLTNSGGDPILLSWSGSMFEYLMPQLVMPSFENTLLHQTSKATVKRQIEYAAQRGVPWGISESGYNMVDANLNYQYRAFGVPGLGLKRGLEEDLVIAPYACMMALMVSPAKACDNLQELSAQGFEGEYGFYEAIDYTASRLPRGKSYSLVNSYMVHHQGMGFLSLAYVLLNKPMQQRFSAELRFQATLLLLQERIPRATLFYAHTADLVETHTNETDLQVRRINTPNTVLPEVQLLSNGRYQAMITNSGAGYSRWKDISVTRWREDATKDDHGIFCYIKDISTGNFWSNTHQPTLQPAKSYEAIFSQGHVEFRRHDHGIDTHTEIIVSPEDDTEMRKIRLTNRTPSVKVLEITSYTEVVMASQASDEAHPAFSNLFVQTEIVPEHKAIFCTRRARSSDEVPPWMFHLMEVRGATVEAVSYETDRMQFIGRGNTIAHPQALDAATLSGKHGSVLDPVLAIRYRISIKPNQTATVDLIYGISETKEGCESLMQKYRDQHLKNRAFELSWTHSQVLLRQLNATESDTQLYDRLAASVIYANPALRADSQVLQSNLRGQSSLWSHSVSGDLPIVLLHVYDTESMDLVKQMIQAHAYWRLKGLAVDLVIWNEDYGSYRQLLQDQILGLITADAANSNHQAYSKPGAIFVKSADQLSSEDRILFESVARVIIHDNKGTLAEQISKHINEKALPLLLDTKPLTAEHIAGTLELPKDLLFFNETGGFTKDGKAYKIKIAQHQTTPAPWVNVIANPDFGSVISENGSAYTWAINAHEYRLTPWSNDPVSDVGGEAFYLRDEETGMFWSPSSFPVQGASPYIVTHGFGYSTFEHEEQGLISETTTFVDKETSIKFIVIKIKNKSGRERKLSATGYLEVTLGDVRSKTNMHIISEYNSNNGALLFRNRYNSAFSDRVMFFKVEGVRQSFTTDRLEFIGKNKTLKDPKALYRSKLSGRIGAGMDTCAALQVKFDLLDGEEKEIIFQMGNEINSQSAHAVIFKFANPQAVAESLRKVKEYWEETVSAVQVTTPDVALNTLANGWLTYQTIACRIFARSGFYQSGGAFGFRDQLQDVLALLHTQPSLARQQILLSASRQFVEGDVQHWWHPPEGRGVRTRCSDDMLWLPFVTSRYLAATSDETLLNTQVGFLESRLLLPEEETLYDLPVSGNISDSLYEHCVRAITHSLHFGVHGLPLIGSGDWNDGMDQVGHKGKGESVWLAFFLYDVLVNFEKVAIQQGDHLFAERCVKEAATLQHNIEASSWDGEWYKRAYFDDGTALGSKENTECRIDAIAQSWSVLSGAAPKDRREMAIASMDKYLVRRDLRLIQLLDPPFNVDGMNPGYIKGYVPGVRENGGQYSHAAIWALMAFAAMGDREKVWELFSMVQPLSHADNAASSKIYKVEPYVMAADVYANESHEGRGGWTWYTGSSGWMYQFITGSLLGMEVHRGHLVFNPCFPVDWPSVHIDYRYGKSMYRMTVHQVYAAESYWKMGETTGKGNSIPLVDDSQEHVVEVFITIAK
ncbi:MAG: glycosyltransferase 36 [Chitinophagaceae bacterium]|nr:glycosyltransferase 36 [Chitinophagaceae bacterium]